MKAKRILTFLVMLALIISVICVTAVSVSAIKVTSEINRVYINMQGAVAGKRARNDAGAVTWVDNTNHYEVTDVQWYKGAYAADDRMKEGEVFLGGNTYCVEVIAKTKGDHIWPESNEDLKKLDAKINAGTPEEVVLADIVRGTIAEPNAVNYVRMVFVYDKIDYGTVYNPSVFLDAPVAGQKPDNSLAFISTLLKQEGEVNWYEMTDKGWTYMQSDKTFSAGKTYRASFEFLTVDGMIFDVPAEPSDETLFVKGWFNGKQIHYVVNRDYYNIAQNRLKASVDFVSVKVEKIESVSFDGIKAPVIGNKPSFDPSKITVGDTTYSIDAENSADGFVNGMFWSDKNGKALTESDTFTSGESYVLSFGIKADAAHTFAEYVLATANVGFAEIFSDPLDAAYCYVNVFFDPCGGGELTNVSVGGISVPVNGSKVSNDYNVPTFGMGYTASEAMEWYDVTDLENPVLVDVENGKWEFGHTYRARIPIEAYSMYSFAEDLEVSVSGAKSVTLESRSGTEIVVLADYKVRPAVYISPIIISTDLLKEGSAAPTVSIINDGITVSEVLWYHEGKDEPMAADEVFVAGYTYQLRLTVNMETEGYIFDDDCEAIVNLEDAFFICNNPSVGFVIYTFMPEELPTATLDFDLGEGMGTVNGIIVRPGDTVTLPSFAGCTAPDGYKFMGWSKIPGGTQVITTYTVPDFDNSTASITFYAYYVPTDTHVHVYTEGRIDLGDGTCGYRCIDDECPDVDRGRGEAPDQDMMHYYGENFTDCDDTCINCGNVRTEVQKYSDGGTPDDPSDDVPYIPLHFYTADCQEYCPNCGEYRETEKAHTPGDAATCTEDQICLECNSILEYAHGHDFRDPTCEEPATCKIDGCEITVGNAIGHTESGAATCTEAKVCTVCDKELEAKLGHTPGAAATCKAAQNCTVCGEEIAAKLAHTPGAAATCTTAETCTKCGEVLTAAIGHSSGVEWISDGDGHYKLCARGDKADEGEHKDDDGDDICDVCGYEISDGLGVGAIIAIVIGAILVLGGGGFCLYVFVIKKKK